MISNMLLRMVYVEMLSSMETKDLLGFVRSSPNFNVGDWSKVWFDEGSLSIFTHRVWLDGFVNWLDSRDFSIQKVIEGVEKRSANLELIPARPILRSYIPYIPQFYSSGDMRKLCLEILPKRTQFLQNMTVAEGVVSEGVRHDFLFASFKDEERIATNYLVWMQLVVRLAPTLLGLPTFEDVHVVASQNSVMMTVGIRAIVDVDGKKVLVNGEPIGVMVPFAECIEANGITWATEYEAKMECVRVTRDFVDEKSGDLLLKEGCYYGAPSNILSVNYKENVTVENPFEKLISVVVKNEQEVWRLFRALHDDFMALMSGSISVIYYTGDDSISVNGKHLMRSVPARILRNILREYTKNGRQEFENREFKRNEEICLDPMRPNFESRLNRVVAHIEKVSKYFEIERSQRGRFRFVPKCRIDYREE